MPDLHSNFAYSTVATAPSPATSGTSLVVASGDGAKFPTVPFNATVWATGVNALAANAEIVRVTAISTDTLTITRAQESSTARTVVVGDQIAATITKKTLTDMEQWIPAAAPSLAGHTALYDGSVMQALVVRAQYDAGVAVSNTGTLTTLLAATMTTKAPYTVGDAFRLIMPGRYLQNSGTATPTWDVRIAGTSVGVITGPSQASNANAHNLLLDVIFVIQTVGASGTVGVGGTFWYGPGSAVGWVAPSAIGQIFFLSTSVTVDTTADLTVNVLGQPGATGASSTITPQFISLSRLPKL